MELGVIFRDCPKLTSVIIPCSMSNIGQLAFSGCTALKDICSYVETALKITTGMMSPFNNVDKNTCILHVPKGTKEVYAAAPGWKDFLNITEDLITGIDEVAVDKENPESICTVDGRLLPCLQRGANIIRSSDGKVSKVFVK